MHFRVRGNVIQCVRTTYDAASKKPKAQVLGRVRKANPQIEDELRLSCTPDELAQLEAYLKNEHTLTQLQMELAARNLTSNIDLAAEWLSLSSSSIENEVLAFDILKATNRLRREISKRFGDENTKGQKTEGQNKGASMTKRQAERQAEKKA